MATEAASLSTRSGMSSVTAATSTVPTSTTEDHRLWMSEDADLIKYIYLVFIPIFAPIIITGAVVGIVTLLKKSIRCHSSAIYLIALFCYDISYVVGEYITMLLKHAGVNLHLSRSACVFFAYLRQNARIGNGLITICLVLERVLILWKPKKFHMLANQGLAITVTIACGIIIALLSSPVFLLAEFNEDLKKCRWNAKLNPAAAEASSNIYFSMIGIQTGSALILCTIHGILVYRKRRSKSADPVHNAVSAARRHSNQFNRINLIVLIVCIQYILINVPMVIHTIEFYIGYNNNYSNGELIAALLGAVALASKATRLLALVIASPKFRKEVYLILTCHCNQTPTSVAIKRVKPEISDEDRLD